MKNGIAFLFAFALAATMSVAGQTPSWPRRVLITNDDGIGHANLLALAKAFQEIAEVWVVAPSANMSSTGDSVQVFRNPGYALKVAAYDLGPGIRAFAVEGTPADCVFVALRGLMRANPPDLVVSGINPGPNLGVDWLYSGTIGAARTAALWGVPAVAASGPRSSGADELARSARWLTQLAQTTMLRNMAASTYLSVSFPAEKVIKGWRVAKPVTAIEYSFVASGGEWRMNPPRSLSALPDNSDTALFNAGYIVVVPLRVEGLAQDIFDKLVAQVASLPAWPPTP